MKKDYAKTADTLIAALGGKDNITRLFHCMTRLRFYVKDRSKINEKEILKLSEISGVNWHEDQFQVIAGNEVNAVYKALEDKGVPTDDAPAANSDSSKSVVSKVIDAITGCMTPMIPALTAAGMIKVVLTLLTTFHLVSETSSTYQVISFIGDVTFYFMPFLIAANAAKVFRVNQSLALFIAGVYLSPTFVTMVAGDAAITLFGLPITKATYSYSVIPVILMVWITHYIEILVDKITPKMVKLILNPTLVILISAPIALIVVGPIGTIIGNGLAVAINFLSVKLGFIIVGILAATFPFIVMTGMHHALTPIGLNAIATGGADTLIFVSQVCSNLAQSGASLAVACKIQGQQHETAGKCSRCFRSYGYHRACSVWCYTETEKTGCSSFHRSRNRWYRRRTSSGFSLHCTELYHGDPGVYRREGIKQSDLWNHYDRGIFWSCFCSYTYLRI